MRRFMRILLAVLFCTTAMCTTCFADTTTSDNVQTSDEQSIHDSIRNVKSTAVNNAFNSYSDEEVYLVAQLVHHEAHNQAYNGKVAIAEVVVNRVVSTMFPNNVKDVVFQSGQFTSSRRLRNINPTEQEIRIAFNVLNGSLRVLKDSDVLYFRNPKITSNIAANIEKNWGSKEYYTHIGEHAFYSQDAKPVAEVAEKKSSLFDLIPTAIEIPGFGKNKKSLASEESAENAEKTETVVPVQNPETVAVSEVKVDETVNENPQSKEVVVSNQSVTNGDDIADSEEQLSVDSAVLMAQANPMVVVVEKEETQTAEKTAVEEELENFDENDPVAIARRRAILDEKAEVERKAREVEEQMKANQKAQEQAVILDQMQVERIARYNEEVARATQAAVDAAKAREGK
ncbi:MAG: cell wall hydrolase [Lachnospiraceae bacterium]|nr:cell wall hydrolase [Lachnospiraceae bacterium]